MRLHARRPTIASRATLPFAVAVLLCSLAFPTAARAQKPSYSRVLHSPAGLTETGLLNGAAYRIDIPENWNRSLVVFYHGYARWPVGFHIAARLTGEQTPFLDRRFAILQSAYSTTGWALQQAYPETESLRRYFIRKYGQPAATYAVGRSMGGDLVAVTLELNPKPYLGGLDLCGSVGPTYQTFDRRFALRAAFDVYFPGVMPSLVPVPKGYKDGLDDRAKVLSALRSSPASATLMRNLTGLRSDQDLARDIAYWTFVIADMQQRGGGNPFDNRNFIYSGTNPTDTTTDLDLNENVKRYAAAPHAQAYLIHHYTPNGRLGRPMLALHTIYDPIVPASQLSLYDHEVQAAGAGDNLVQQIVDREGHCNFTQNEIGDAFDELIRWTHGGPRPTPGVLKQ